MRVNILKNESKTNVLKLSFFGLFFFLAQAVSDDFDENYRKSYMINEFILMRWDWLLELDNIERFQLVDMEQHIYWCPVVG